MFSAGKVQRESKFAPDGNHASRDLGAWNRTGIPRIQQEQQRPQSHADAITFVGHDGKYFIEILKETRGGAVIPRP